MSYRGEFHGEFSSADASALAEEAQRFTLYLPGGKVAVPAIAATDMVVVTQLIVGSAAAISVTVFDGADNVPDVGEILYDQSHAVNTVKPVRLDPAHKCIVGTYPKVKTSAAGAVKVQVKGFIVTNAVVPIGA